MLIKIFFCSKVKKYLNLKLKYSWIIYIILPFSTYLYTKCHRDQDSRCYLGCWQRSRDRPQRVCASLRQVCQYWRHAICHRSTWTSKCPWPWQLRRLGQTRSVRVRLPTRPQWNHALFQHYKGSSRSFRAFWTEK